MKLADWPKQERPREKLLTLGACALTDAELLAIFLRTGISGLNAVELSAQLIQRFGSLRALLAANRQDFCAAKGLGDAKFVQLQAVLEMARRYLLEPLQRGAVFCNAEDTRNYLIARLRDEPHEVFAMLLLDAQHRLIAFKAVFQGTIDSAAVHPRVLVKTALDHQAAAVILAHNHPSGVAEPSEADRQITQRICDAMALMDIRVLDHFVIGDGQAVSFAERGLL
ncbi:DNA repair protein RadC [Aliiglaciecola sp. CAU 1673]|uniref:RadC family protein n=1 Tax=Aliiglaciecola sp. CAU 1673 TaxID=3032595 RepID=UPI0023DCBD3D|nr:DNA repair protein RadC [Aliiglaciecola sp. CAU 1673]MDF2179287.1 DNA repair protein RadC [Aliiglaciecola sp. CAU 1673]